MHEFDKLLQQLEGATEESDRVSVADIRHRLGDNAFGPALLTLGIIALSPIGDIPGAPTVMSGFIVLIAAQLAAGRENFWLPQFLLRRSLKAGSLRRAVRLVRPVGRFLGKIIWQRVAFLTRGAFARAIGAACALLALMLPPLEVVPFGATVPSSAITAFGLALVARDGLLASLALLLSGAGVYLVATI